MNRSLYGSLALLLPLTALAAPAPEPFVSGWDKPLDPDNDCRIKHEKGALTIEMPGTVHEYSRYRKRLNAPRLLRDIESDFEMQVRVRIDCRPSAHSSVKDQPSYVSAGFLIIPPDANGIAMERLEYRVAGQGDESDGCAVMLQSGNDRGEGYSAWSKQHHPAWPFKSKPDHVYLRFVRRGEMLSIDISADRVKWLSFGGGLRLGLPSKLKIGLVACTTSIDPSKVVFDQLSITHGKKRVPWEFVTGWGNPIDPDKDCKIQRDKGSLTIEIPGSDHEYDPARKRFNAPRLISELEGEFDLQVRVRIDYRPSAQSSVKGRPSFVSAGFLLIYPEREYSICDRLEHAVALPGSRLGAPRVEARRAEMPRKDSVQKGKEADSYAVIKTWIGKRKRHSKTLEWDHGSPKQMDNTMWDRGWPKWPLPEKADYAHLRLEMWEGAYCFYISPDGEKWTRLGYFPHVQAKSKLALAAYSTSTEPSKVRFDQLKLWQYRKKSK